MEYIKKKELIKGEVYKNSDLDTIFKAHRNKIPSGIGFRISNSQFAKHNYFSGNNAYLIATSKEKHWLLECIKLNKFITFEEAMKTFIPEYYEYIKENINGFTKNKIYKCLNPNNLEKLYNFIDDNNTPNGYSGKNYQYFKPSTKEAYDAQFVVKEPEFVLPENWGVKCNISNYKPVKEWAGYDWWKDNFNKFITHNKTWLYENNGSYTEITFEQFKKYVLKEEIVEEKVIEPLPQFKVIETIEIITKVENNEGNQFFIGDIIKSELNHSHKIKSFEYNNDKTEIFAINEFEVAFNINKIEHYIEPKVEFILPKKWAILRTDENDKVVTDYINSISSFNHSYLNNNRHYPYLHNITNRCCSSNKIIADYTEITFDQFKKYVLKENNIKLPIIGLDLAQESLLDKAKRLYPVGTKFKNAYNNDTCTIKEGDFFEGNNNNIYHSIEQNACKYEEGCSGCVYFNNNFAEIIEYPHGFKVGDKIKLKLAINPETHKIIKIEGNDLFYNFKNKEFKILAKNAIKVN